MKRASGEERLDLVISLILIVGVVASLLLEVAGLFGLLYLNGNLSIAFAPEFALKGSNFFAYAVHVIQVVLLGRWTPTTILTLGLVLLMMTPYLRVVASAAYFAAGRDLKYFLITLFVLVILTGSLLTH